MRIVEINSVAGIQSTGRIVSDIKKELILRGHECLIVYGEKASIDVKGNYHIGCEIDRYIHAGTSRLFDNTGKSSKIATCRLVKKLYDYKPDLIHIHNIHGYYINYEILFRYIEKEEIPVVWTLHDCWPFTGHCAHFDLVKCEKWKNQCYKCPQKNEYPKSVLFDNSKNNYIFKKKCFTSVNKMVFVSPSYWLKSLVDQSFLNKYECKVIHNGIDVELFNPNTIKLDKTNFTKKKILLGVSSVWQEKKGLYDFIKLDKKISSDYQIVLIGMIPRGITLEKNNIMFIDRTNDIGELVKWYSNAYCFLNLTYEDNFPTVNIEALACGTPVITYDSGGSKEMLSNDCGLAVEKGDINSIISALPNISYERNACINRGREFNKHEKYQEYINLFESLNV